MLNSMLVEISSSSIHIAMSSVIFRPFVLVVAAVAAVFDQLVSFV